jgi:hypothetical protein
MASCLWVLSTGILGPARALAVHITSHPTSVVPRRPPSSRLEFTGSGVSCATDRVGPLGPRLQVG